MTLSGLDGGSERAIKARDRALGAYEAAMESWAIVAVAMALVVSDGPGAQAKIRYVTGSATFAPPSIVGAAGQDYANALHASPRAPTVVDFAFSFDDVALPTPLVDTWDFKVSDFALKVNGVALASGAKPFTSVLRTYADTPSDSYIFQVQQHAELIPGAPAARYFQFGFEFFLDSGVTADGVVPTPAVVSDSFKSVRAQFDVRSASTGPELSYVAFNGSQVSIAEGVPEPQSWALMLLGFGAAGAALRKRRRAAVA